MLLEDQVTSLELSNKLKSINLIQLSSFYWYQPLGEEWELQYIDYNHHETDREIFLKKHNEAISAYLASEVFKFLPSYVTLDENNPLTNYRLGLYPFTCFEKDKISMACGVSYYCTAQQLFNEKSYIGMPLENASQYDQNMANALAKMLIYLYENDLHFFLKKNEKSGSDINPK